MEFNATFLIAAVSFVVFTIIMNAIFYKPLQKIVDERQKFTEDTNAEAKVNNEKAEGLLKNKKVKVDGAKRNAKLLISKKSDEAKAKKTALTTDAQHKVQQEVETAKNSLHQDCDNTKNSLADTENSLAEMITSKILGSK